jgi:hypothetical protein
LTPGQTTAEAVDDATLTPPWRVPPFRGSAYRARKPRRAGLSE